MKSGKSTRSSLNVDERHLANAAIKMYADMGDLPPDIWHTSCAFERELQDFSDAVAALVQRQGEGNTAASIVKLSETFKEVAHVRVLKADALYSALASARDFPDPGTDLPHEASVARKTRKILPRRPPIRFD